MRTEKNDSSSFERMISLEERETKWHSNSMKKKSSRQLMNVTHKIKFSIRHYPFFFINVRKNKTDARSEIRRVWNSIEAFYDQQCFLFIHFSLLSQRTCATTLNCRFFVFKKDKKCPDGLDFNAVWRRNPLNRSFSRFSFDQYAEVMKSDTTTYQNLSRALKFP